MNINKLEQKALWNQKVRQEHKQEQIATEEVQRDIGYEKNFYRNIRNLENELKKANAKIIKFEDKIERLKYLLKQKIKK